MRYRHRRDNKIGLVLTEVSGGKLHGGNHIVYDEIVILLTQAACKQAARAHPRGTRHNHTALQFLERLIVVKCRAQMHGNIGDFLLRKD